MKYEKVFEEVKKISPYAIWGKVPNDKRGLPFLIFGLDRPLHFLKDNIQKFYSVIDRVCLDAIHTNGEDAARNDTRLKIIGRNY